MQRHIFGEPIGSSSLKLQTKYASFKKKRAKFDLRRSLAGSIIENILICH